MTDAVQIALIVSMPTTLVAIGTFILGLVNRRQGKSNHRQGTVIKQLVDGRMDAIVQELAAVRIELAAANAGRLTDSKSRENKGE